MIDKAALYELPWTREHNPNGWIEPTTLCQLKCPMCFRGADLDGHRPAHVPLADVIEDVDELIRRRGVSTITIAGGEPLLYPDLDALVDDIRSRGVAVMILTNGLELDEPMLRRLKAHGVARIMIHIDKYQGRPGMTTEEDTLPLRASFCELFRKVGGVSLGFIQPIGHTDLDDFEVLLPFYKRNADVVDLVAFNRLQPVVDFTRLPSEHLLQAQRFFDRVRDVYGLEYGAYLGKTHSEDISWLFGQAVFSGTELIGSLDRDAFRFFQEETFRRTGQYLHCSTEGVVSLRLLLFAPFNRSLRRILLRLLRDRLTRTGGRPTHQLVLLINTPRLCPDGELDRCKGCPDAMLYENRLVPSCLLEQVKFGRFVEAG